MDIKEILNQPEIRILYTIIVGYFVFILLNLLRDSFFPQRDKTYLSIMSKLFETRSQTQAEFKELQNKFQDLRTFQHSIETRLLFGSPTSEPELDSIPIYRYLLIEYFIDTSDVKSIKHFNSYCKSLLEYIGFVPHKILFERTGSFWKKLFVSSKEMLTNPEVQNRLQQAEHALKVKHIDQAQSIVDKNQADGIANMLSATQNIPNVAFRIGSLLTIKTTDEKGNPSLFATTLSSSDIIKLQQNPSLLSNPKKVLAALQQNSIHSLLTPSNTR